MRVLNRAFDEQQLQIYQSGTNLLKSLLESPIAKIKKEDLNAFLKPLIAKLRDQLTGIFSKESFSTIMKISKLKNVGKNFILNIITENPNSDSEDVWKSRINLLETMIKEFKLKPDGILNTEVINDNFDFIQ